MKLLASLALGALALAGAAANAADVHVMISAGFYGAYEQLAPGFEKATGNHLLTTRGPSMGDSPESLPTRLSRGESADVVILDGGAADELVAKGLARAEGETRLARSTIAMVVKEGASKPDISTADALKQTLLAARSVAYSDSGSGTYLSTRLFNQLGIQDQVMAKSRKVRGPPSGEPVAAVISRGEAEIGFQQLAELMHTPGVTIVGPLPRELQPEIFFSAALAKDVQQKDAALSLIRYLSSPEARPVLIKAGLAPVSD
jgi:molybdate transport system substrate-binding protein